MAEITGSFDAAGLRIAVAVADFNAAVTAGLLAGALEALAGAGAEDPMVVHVPGAFELPVVVARLATAGYDAVVALGAVIAGETDHYEHVATQCAAGLRQVAITTGIPVGFGVLTARDAAHAARAEPCPARGTRAPRRQRRRYAPPRALRGVGGLP